jgi:hypothetical protein
MPVLAIELNESLEEGLGFGWLWSWAIGQRPAGGILSKTTAYGQSSTDEE